MQQLAASRIRPVNLGQHTAGFMSWWNRLASAIAPGGNPNVPQALEAIEEMERKLAAVKGALLAVGERQR